MKRMDGDRKAIPINMVLLLLISASVGSGYLMSRDTSETPPWWLLGIGMVATIIGLSRFDGRGFAPPLRGVITIFVVWRLLLWIMTGLGVWYGNVIVAFAGAITIGSLPGFVSERTDLVWNTLVARWMMWDAAHYQTIALSGYSFAAERFPTIAFFPLYPLLIRLLLPIAGGNGHVAAVLVSHSALLAALLLLYDLVARDFTSAVAYRTLVFLLLFPTSFFFIAGYSESLALALTVGVLWAVRRERWWLAGIFGCCLTLTRLPGIMITPLIAITYLQHCNWRWRAIRSDALTVVLPPAGLALFMGYQWWAFGTPVAFLLAQENWNSQLSAPWVIPHNLLTWIRQGSGAPPLGEPVPMLMFQALVWLSFLVLTLLALRRLPLAYGLLTLLLLVPPYLNNRAHGLPRYVLLAFPAFVVLALLAERWWVRLLLISIMLPLLTIAVFLFINTYWVA